MPVELPVFDPEMLRGEMRRRGLNATGVAERAGVSRITVSHALNWQAVSDESERRIWRAVMTAPIRDVKHIAGFVVKGT